MKRAYLLPLAVLAAILTFSLWNSANMTAQTDRWRQELRQVDALVQTASWPQAASALRDSYKDWTDHQTYLHIVSHHDAVDDAEAMYRRAQAFAATRETSELRAELSDLMDQLRLLSEMEQFNVKNVL